MSWSCILVARKITCNGERTITIDLRNRLESLPRRQDSASDVVREVSTTSSIKGMEFIHFKVQYIMILSLCVRFQVDSVSWYSPYRECFLRMPFGVSNICYWWKDNHSIPTINQKGPLGYLVNWSDEYNRIPCVLKSRKLKNVSYITGDFGYNTDHLVENKWKKKAYWWTGQTHTSHELFCAAVFDKLFQCRF